MSSIRSPLAPVLHIKSGIAGFYCRGVTATLCAKPLSAGLMHQGIQTTIQGTEHKRHKRHKKEFKLEVLLFFLCLLCSFLVLLVLRSRFVVQSRALIHNGPNFYVTS